MTEKTALHLPRKEYEAALRAALRPDPPAPPPAPKEPSAVASMTAEEYATARRAAVATQPKNGESK